MARFRPSAAVLLPFLLLPDPARACSCLSTPASYAVRRLEVPAVFHGKAVAAGRDEAEHVRWIRFQVIRDYSVDGSIVEDTAMVWTPALGAASCGEYFPIGEEALVFAYNLDYSTDPPRRADRLWTSLCSRNIRGAPLPGALQALDEAVGVRNRGRRPASRSPRAVVACGQILFGGKVRADGALRGPGTR